MEKSILIIRTLSGQDGIITKYVLSLVCATVCWIVWRGDKHVVLSKVVFLNINWSLE